MKKIIHFLFNIDHFIVAIISLLFTAILFFLFSFNVGFLNPVRRAFADFSMSDVYYSILWQGTEPTESQDITLIDIDTLFLRRDIAQVIKQIDQYKPKVVGIDIIFEGQKFDSEGDSILAQTLEENIENKVIGYKLLDPESGIMNFKNSLHSYFVDNISYIQEGYTNALYSEAGTTLRMFTIFRKENGIPNYSFPAQVYSNYIEEEYKEIDTTQLNDRHINFSTINFPIVRFDSIANHPELIKDRIVLIGTINEEADMHYSPIGRISGLKIQAYSVQSLIDRYEINVMDQGSVWLIAFLATYITGLLQFGILRWLKKKNRAWTKFLLKSVVFIRLFTFFILALIAYFAFLLYAIEGIFISTTAILVAAVLTSEARGVYTAIVNNTIEYCKKHNLPLLGSKSIFADPSLLEDTETKETENHQPNQIEH